MILITGCSSGIGFNIALKFARNGHKTYASLRNLAGEGAKKLLTIRTKENLPLEVIQIDVTKEETITKSVTEILSKEGHIDVLINNAGFGYLGAIEDFSITEIKDQYETNIFGVLRMVKEVAPQMREQRQGLIINVSSINGLVPFPLFSIYSSSKFAIETLSEGLRFELSHFGVKVVLIEPGSFATKFSENRKYPKNLGTTASAYKELTDNFFARYKKTHDASKVGLVSKVVNPEKVVNKIYEIAQTSNPKPRYKMGYDAFFFYYLKKLAPWWLWEKLLHKAYKW